MLDLPRLAVVHGQGAASPLEIVAAARKLCDIVFLCDEREVAELSELAPAYGVGLAGPEVQGIVTFSERQIGRCTELAEAAGLTYHSPRVAACLVDKRRQRAALGAANVASARCVEVSAPEDVPAAVAETGLPVVIKPRSGAGSVNTVRADSVKAAVAAMTEFGPGEFVVEELLVGDPDSAGHGFGDYVSVESIVYDGEIDHVCVTGKLPLAEPFRETGHFQPAALAPGLTERVLDLAGQALRALGIRWGVTHTEIKLTGDGPRIIEVNGRMGGFVGAILRRATGFDLIRAALEVALGIRPRRPNLVFDRVGYQYFITPPVGARRLVELRGVDDVTSLDGVWQVRVAADPGAEIDWRRGTDGRLGEVHGTAADHDDFRRQLAAIDRTLDAVYE